MKITMFLAAALAVTSLAACQPPAATEPSPETPAASTEETAAAPAQLPCGILAQRNWQAQVASGASPTLTVSGEIDLGTPGYGVSLARPPSETAGATSTTLTLALRAPSGVQTQVVTAHSVRYFGPAAGPYTTVSITCDGAALTDINVTP